MPGKLKIELEEDLDAALGRVERLQDALEMAEERLDSILDVVTDDEEMDPEERLDSILDIVADDEEPDSAE